jgi:hypothetical protein
VEQNRETREVTGMEANEIAVYDLYSAQSLPRDELPYTEEFNRMVATYQQNNDPAADHHAVWRLLGSVLKAGEQNIRRYLGR